MKIILRSTLLSIAAVAFAANSLAQNRYSQERYPQASTPRYDVARVISSQPIYETVEQDRGREVCRNQQVHHAVPEYSRGYDRPRSESASVFGAILGGVIGNQFGRGRGRVAATVAGVALGSAVANDAQRQDRYRERYANSGRSVVTTERICTYEPDVRRERELVGYNVRYDYKGQIGETTTRSQPGSTIRVQLDVTPIED
jgi:uncharacterized protein YcfJ